LLQIISKAKDFEALQMLGSGAKESAAPSPRTSLDAQQTAAAAVAAASAISAMSSSAAERSARDSDAANGIPPFEATEEWLAALRDSLPLEPSLRVLHHLQVRAPPPPLPLNASREM